MYPLLMDIYINKYLKYKNKYLLLKNQIGSASSLLESINVDKCSIVYNNYTDSCWNLVLQLFLFISDEFNADIQIKLIQNESEDLVNNAKLNVLFSDNYIRDNKEIIIKIIDNIRFRFMNKLSELPKSESYTRHMTDIQTLSKSELLTTKIKEITDDDLPADFPPKMKKIQSLYCELNTETYFRELIYKYTQTPNIGKGGTRIDRFILCNLLSIVFLDKLLIISEFDKNEKIILPPNYIGVVVRIFDHVTCFYTCNETPRYSNNGVNIDYNWHEFIKDYNSFINDSIEFNMYLEWNLHPVLDIIGPYIVINTSGNYTLLCYNKKQPNNTYIVLTSTDDPIYIYNLNTKNDIINFEVISFYTDSNIPNILDASYYSYIIEYKNNNIFNFLSLYTASLQNEEFYNFMSDTNITIEKLNNNMYNIDIDFFGILINNLELLNNLLDSGLNINITDLYQDTLLHIACDEKNKAIVKLLLNKNIDCNIQNKYGDTGLHLACKNNDKEIVKLLLDKKVKCDIQNINGDTGLHIAVENKYQEISILLLEAVTTKNSKYNLSIQDKYGDTLLHLACKNNNKEIVKLLLDKKININLQDKYDETALHLACREKSKDIVELLLSSNIDINIKDIYNQTALHIACRENSKDIVDLLLTKNININIKDMYGRSAIHIALDKNFINIVKSLLTKNKKNEYICDPTIQNNNGDTLLHLALKINNFPIDGIKYILMFKCNFTLKNIDGNTLLHLACIRNDYDIVNLLISKILKEKNYNLNRLLNIKNANNKTPFNIAYDNKNNNIKKLISIKK